MCQNRTIHFGTRLAHHDKVVFLKNQGFLRFIIQSKNPPNKKGGFDGIFVTKKNIGTYWKQNGGKRMEYKDLINALKKMKVETGSLVCLGCGHEYGCSLHGCYILREAIRTLENKDKSASVVHKETTEKMLNPAGEYAVKLAENHGISIAEAMELPIVKARFDVFNATGK